MPETFVMFHNLTLSHISTDAISNFYFLIAVPTSEKNVFLPGVSGYGYTKALKIFCIKQQCRVK